MIAVNWYSNLQFFKKLLRIKLKAEFMLKIELNTNRRDWKECENNKKNVHAKHKNVIKNIKGKKSLSGNATVTSPVYGWCASKSQT